MCFSATASFGASLVIGAVGIATMKANVDPRRRLFAAIPFLFAIQQFTEGFVWLSFDYPAYSYWRSNAAFAFLFFAWFVWPIMIPASVFLMEPAGIRKKVIAYSLAMGLFAGFFFLFRMIVSLPQPYVVNFHIDYSFFSPVPDLGLLLPAKIMYALATILPLFLSSMKGIKALALANLAALILAYLFYRESLPSTWCFFAAGLSGIIYFLLRLNNKLGFSLAANHDVKP